MDLQYSNDTQTFQSGVPVSSSRITRSQHESPSVSRIDELEAQLDALTTTILPPMRAGTCVDRDDFAKLSQLVTNLISRLARNLSFRHHAALVEADHSRSPEEVLHYTWSYQDQLDPKVGACQIRARTGSRYRSTAVTYSDSRARPSWGRGSQGNGLYDLLSNWSRCPPRAGRCATYVPHTAMIDGKSRLLTGTRAMLTRTGVPAGHPGRHVTDLPSWS